MKTENYLQKLQKYIIPNNVTSGTDEQSPAETLEKISQATSTPKDALARMLLNLDDINEYYTWSQKQAKDSFALAVAMCVCCFLLMALTVFFALKFQIADSVTIISGVGTAVTGVIAGTALLVYNNSIKQLNFYHTALHEDERFLSSINLISWFSTPEKKDAMLQTIIESELKLNEAPARSESIKNKRSGQED
jgi:hypothetical protein